MTSPQSLIAARLSMMYAQQGMSPLQQQQAEAHGQLRMSSGTTYGFNIFHGEASMGDGGGAGNNMMNAGVFSDYGGGGGAKEWSISLSADARGGAHSSHGEYLNVTEEEGSYASASTGVALGVAAAGRVAGTRVYKLHFSSGEPQGLTHEISSTASN